MRRMQLSTTNRLHPLIALSSKASGKIIFRNANFMTIKISSQLSFSANVLLLFDVTWIILRNVDNITSEY